MCCRRCDPQLLELLVEHGERWNARSLEYCTPLPDALMVKLVAVAKTPLSLQARVPD